MSDILSWPFWNSGLFTVLGPVVLGFAGIVIKKVFFGKDDAEAVTSQTVNQSVDVAPVNNTSSSNSGSNSSSSTSGNNINNTINFTLPNIGGELPVSTSEITPNSSYDMRKLESIKSEVRILFIDDNYFRIVDILKKSGWINVKLINEVESFNQKEIMEANIIFVDIQGVGEALGYTRDGGLGLASVFKSDEKYKDKKIILYSAEQSGNIFNETIRKVDATLKKDAAVYEFEKLIEDFSMEIFGNV